MSEKKELTPEQRLKAAQKLVTAIEALNIKDSGELYFVIKIAVQAIEPLLTVRPASM